MRAVIYARYSSENQREASIEDQLEVCRRLIAREGWTLLRTYTDAAISGASRFRPGLQQLRCDAERGAFDVIVCEALDRIGRKLADVAELHDLLSYLGIKLVTLATGEVTSLHIGMLGTLAQLTLADLREKTRRGQLGRALQGKIPGGRAYGYDVVDPRSKDGRGERAINAAEAEVVRRIFAAFANGESPARDRQAAQRRGRPGTGRPRLAGHHHPRSGRSRHRPAQQRRLRRPAGVEPLLVRQGPAHRQARCPGECERALGDRRGAGAAHRR